MLTLILFKSKWGSTKLYADWISESAGNCEVHDMETFDLSNLSKFEKIVIGSRTYLGQIQAARYLEKNWSILSQKPVYLFSVGLVDWSKPDAKKAYELIPDHIRNGLAGHVKLQGKIEKAKLNYFEKLMVRMIKGGHSDIDKMDKKSIQPIVEFIKS